MPKAKQKRKYVRKEKPVEHAVNAVRAVPHRVGGFVREHKYIIGTFLTVGAGVLGIVAATKTLPVGAATAVGIAIGYITVTAVGGIGAMAMKDGKARIAVTVDKEHVPA